MNRPLSFDPQSPAQEMLGAMSKMRGLLGSGFGPSPLEKISPQSLTEA